MAEIGTHVNHLKDRQITTSNLTLGLKKFERLYAKRYCNFFHIIQRNIAYLALDVRNEGPVEISFKCQHLLCPISFRSQPY